MLDAKDRIFTNLYGMPDPSLKGAMARGPGGKTAQLVAVRRAPCGGRRPATNGTFLPLSIGRPSSRPKAGTRTPTQ